MSSFADISSWAWLIQLFLIIAALLIANLIRCNVPLFRRSLLPSALLAGLLILCLKPLSFFNELVDRHVMEIITYHALGLGFVAMALKNKKIKSSTTTMKVVETGAVTASTYILQGLAGLLITIPLFLWWKGSNMFYSGGMLLPMGYGQGPGQALNFGVTFSDWAADQGIAFFGKDFGLSIAAMGFIVGSLVGVVYMNVLRRRGKLKVADGTYVEKYTLEDYESEGEIPHSESIDKLTVQLCLVLLVYAMVFLLMYGIQQLDLGNFGVKTLKPLVWGFNFLWGTLFGVLVKWIIGRLRKSNLMQREYINNYTLDRIAGTCFDFMIVAGTAAIDFHNLRAIWLPLLLVCALGALVTFWYVLRCCRKLYPDYTYEAFFSMFGMLTGTASNGMILLREIDPRFETPAANNLVLQTIPALAFGFPVLLLMGFAPQSLTNTFISVGIMVVALAIFALFIFRKPRKGNGERKTESGKQSIGTVAVLAVLLTATASVSAQENEKHVRTGWNFGVLPSVAFDADLGFQYGALTNIYYFGDGSTYPEYLHSFYAEAAYTTKHFGIFRGSYDSKYLIPNHRLSVDLTYLPDQMCDFYGFNGYESYYNPAYSNQDDAAYLTRAYYKYRRDLFRFSADLQGEIHKPWYWNVGLGVLHFAVGPVDVDRLNKFTKDEDKKLPDTTTLFDRYVLHSYIRPDEATGGTHPYVHGGITFDTRDRQQNPRRGIHADAFLTYYAGIGSMSNYNNLKFNAAWRHYLPIVANRLTLAYRVGTQLTIAGDCPFYLNTYLNQLYMQRVVYEGLGGANSVRGIMRNRILAPGVAFANLELRTQIFSFKVGKNQFYVGLNPFVDAGMVVQPYDDVPTDPILYELADPTPGNISPFVDNSRLHSLHLSGGCGLKLAMNDNFVLSIDWATAFDKQDNGKFSNLYIKMGYMF